MTDGTQGRDRRAGRGGADRGPGGKDKTPATRKFTIG